MISVHFNLEKWTSDFLFHKSVHSISYVCILLFVYNQCKTSFYICSLLFDGNLICSCSVLLVQGKESWTRISPGPSWKYLPLMSVQMRGIFFLWLALSRSYLRSEFLLVKTWLPYWRWLELASWDVTVLIYISLVFPIGDQSYIFADCSFRERVIDPLLVKHCQQYELVSVRMDLKSIQVPFVGRFP